MVALPKVDATLLVRAVQCVFSIITLGFTAYVVMWWKGYWHDVPPSAFTFLLFAAVWSLPAITFQAVAPRRFPRVANKFALLGLDGVTSVFWFIGFVRLAVFLSTRVCFGTVCNVAKASVAFAAFEWCLFMATTVYQGFFIFRGPRGMPAKSLGQPAMSGAERYGSA